MAKRVVARPDWLEAARVADVFSVSGCICEDFADYVGYWRHNGYWFFDSPEIIRQLARAHSIDLTTAALFFYEAYEFELDAGRWTPFERERSFATDVVLPDDKTLEGFDVVTFFARTGPECSPLSCNSLAVEVETNEHCLFASFEQAKRALDEGKFSGAEPGPYRIFAVHSVQWP